jgi:hypothetical protein
LPDIGVERLEIMEPDSRDILHTVVLTRLTDEASREGVAQALSRLGGLPVERVLRRLDTLPWTLIKGARREKTLRLVALLNHLKVEFVAIPPVAATTDRAATEPEASQETPDEVGDSVSSEDRPVPSADAEDYTAAVPTTAEPSASKAPPPWERRLDHTQREAGDLVRSACRAMEPSPLEGVLDPDFRMDRPDSWLLAMVQIPWNIFSGTLRALSGTLDRSFDLCRTHFWRLFAIEAIPWIIAAGIALAGILIGFLLGVTLDALWGLPVWSLVAGVVILVPASIFAMVVALFLPQAALIHALSETYLGRDVPIAQAYRFAWTKLVRYILTSSLMVLAAFGLVLGSTVAAALLTIPLAVGLAWTGSLHSPVWIVLLGFLATVAFVVPLAYCLPRLLLFDKVVIIEESAYSDALGRSWNLLSGRAGESWYTSYYWLFGTLLLVLIPLQWGIHFLFQGPALLMVYLWPASKVVGTYSAQVLSTFGSLLTRLYVGAALVLFYYCIRSRKEGHDLMALVQADGEDASVHREGQGITHEDTRRSVL